MNRIFAFLLLAASATCAEDLWKERVQPLLEQRCVECHGPKKAKHGLRLDSLAGILAGGKDLGPAVVPGKPEESPLLKVLQLPRDDELAMPPQGKGEPLTAEQLGWLKAWIAAGATAAQP